MSSEMNRRAHLRRSSSLRRIGIAGLCMLVFACNARTPVFDNVPSFGPTPTETVLTPPVPLPVSTLSSLTFVPQGTMGGGIGRGNLLLTLPAPPGGMRVNLSNTDAAISIPPSIAVPEGAESADFQYSTQTVAADRQVTVGASVPGRTVSGTLSIWAVLPTFFSFNSDRNDVIGRGRIVRLTPENARFVARCSASQVSIQVLAPTTFWGATFAAPAGTPMRVGEYTNAAAASIAPFFPNTSGPELSISGDGAGCSASTGSFVVHEVDLTATGRVRQFWATFEQRCRPDAALRGDVRVTNLPDTTTSNCTVR